MIIKSKKILIFFCIILFIFVMLNDTGLGQLGATVKDDLSKSISPMETASFEIEITNYYGGTIKIDLSVESVPAGWKTLISDSVTIDANSKSHVTLAVIPPSGFGYHNDMANITVLVGSEYISLNVLVESRGFSLEGIESILLIIIVVIFIAVSLYLIYRKRIKK